MPTEQSVKKFDSKLLFGVIIGVLAVIILLGVFWLGTEVGVRRSSFACHWGERFGDRAPAPMMERFGRTGFPPDELREPDAANGAVVSVKDNEITVKDRAGAEKSIAITPQTVIRRGSATIKASELKTDERIVVFGAPSSTGQIEANFIRVMGEAPAINK